MELYNCVGAITVGALSTPEIYGAVGDGLTDDSDALQRTMDKGGLICFSAGKTYKITKTIKIKKNTIINLNGATIQSENAHAFFNFLASDSNVITGYEGNGNIVISNGKIIGGCISFAHGQNILIKNVSFSDCINDHFFEIAGCKNFTITDCDFIGMSNTNSSSREYINIDMCEYYAFPWVSPNTAFYDGTKNDGIFISHCNFSIGEGSYAYGDTAIGVHFVPDSSNMHRNIIINDNVIKSFTLCGIRVNNMDDVHIARNNIKVAGDGIRVGDVSKSTNVIIKGNIIFASGTAVTKANSSTAFQSSDNDINPTFS